jgi:6-phosphogluconolactonase (cycloisomerase 2 family)
VLDLSLSGTQQFAASGSYTDNTQKDLTGTVTWDITNDYVATITGAGELVAGRPGHATISAGFGGFTGSAELTVHAAPRFLYSTSESGRLITRNTIDNSTGRLRHESYKPTLTTTGVFECLTTDPSQKNAYLAQQIQSGATLSGRIDVFSIDQATGLMSSVGGPLTTTSQLGCVHFEPGGKYAYSVAAVNSVNSPITVLSRNPVDGTLSVANTVQLSTPVDGLVIDPLGQYLYASAMATTSGSQSMAYGFAIDATTGELSAVPGTPFALSNNSGEFSIDQSGTHVYMSNAGGNTIDVYSLDRSTGKLTAVPTASVTTCVNPTQLQFAANNNFAYLGCSMDISHTPNSATIESFSVGPNGSLAHIGSAPSSVTPQRLALDPSDRFAFLAGFSNYIPMFQITSDGVAHANGSVGSSNSTNSLLVTGGISPVTYSTTHAYVSSLGDNHLSSYSVAADGTFSPLSSPLITLSGPFALSSQPWTNDMLLGSSGAKPNATPYVLSSSGDPVVGFNFGDATTLGGITTDISDLWGFASDATQGVIYTYINQGGNSWGLLTFMPSGQAPIGSFPAGPGAGPLAVDPAGRFLYVANTTGKSISAFEYFGTSPELISWGRSPFGLVANPTALAVSPSGLFLYVTTADQHLSTYSIDYFTQGNLSLADSKTVPGQPTGVAAEPAGNYVYVATSSGVTAFSTNRQTGALSQVALNSSLTFSNCNGVWVEPSGKYLYAATSTTAAGGSGEVRGYSINSDGTLTSFPSNPVATLNQPSSMTFKAAIQ